MKAWLTRDEDKAWGLWTNRPFFYDFSGVWDTHPRLDSMIPLKPSDVPAHLRRRKGGPDAIWPVEIKLEVVK